MSDPQEFQYDVFLSHNSAQKDWTRSLAQRLRDDGFRVFFDEWEMPKHLGSSWIDVLEQSVQSSRRVALVLSPDFFSHDWTRFEGNIIQLLDPVATRVGFCLCSTLPAICPDDGRFFRACR